MNRIWGDILAIAFILAVGYVLGRWHGRRL